MSASTYGCKRAKTGQRGVAAVELALVAIPFFLLLLGAIEFGRLMYVWNTVQEVTRNAARQAVVTDFNNTAALNGIRYAAVFQTSPGSLPAALEVTNDNIKVSYLSDAVGTLSTTPLPTLPSANITACLSGFSSCIRYVEVCVVSAADAIPQNVSCASSAEVSFSPMIGLFSNLGVLKIPRSTVRMPAESLGFVPG